MSDKKLDVGNYGMYLFSFKKLTTFLKENKIRSKKLLEFFQKNHNEYLESIKTGTWIPIVPIDSIEYIVKVNDLFDNEWDEIREEKGFCLEIGSDNSLWIGSFSDILTIDFKSFKNNSDGYKCYETLDGQKIYDSFKFDVPQGKYIVNIKGFKRKKELEYPNTNFGFLFELEKVESFNEFKDPREDDKYDFNICQM